MPCPSMSASHRKILLGLEQFKFDSPLMGRFTQRLAKENGWSVTYTLRVINEYRRYLFLTASAGHVVCPSEDVDQAWHLHLVYTQSYWNDLCANILGYPLHHHPSAGGSSEFERHQAMYAETLAAYERLFGETPPGDIWPDVKTRFACGDHNRRINLATHWVLPKISWSTLKTHWPTVRRPHVAGSCAILFPIGAAVWNPLDWTGVEFILLYVLLFILAVIAAVVVRTVLRQPEGDVDESGLSVYEVACLKNGSSSVPFVVLASMLKAGTLVWIPGPQSTGKWFSTKPERRLKSGPHPLAIDAHQLERAFYEKANFSDGVLIHELRELAVAHANQLIKNLKRRHLVVSDETSLRIRRIGLLIFLSLLAFGVVKLGVGIWREKPIGFLAVSCIVVAAASFAANTRPFQTSAAQMILKEMQSRQGRLKTRQAAPLTPAQAALGIVLFGSSAIEAAELSELQHAWKDSISRHANAASGSGCGGTTSGGGCGGGGCGGGGCGGCGGGD